mgnify:FL=1|jgi:hypothetical protein
MHRLSRGPERMGDVLSKVQQEPDGTCRTPEG